MSNDQILHFAELQVPEACRECIVRDIMVVDGIEYDEAMKIFNNIAKSNREKIGFSAYPFYVGLSTSVVASYVSLPLVFELNTVKWFNQNYVTADLPEPKDLETFLEVGSWSWNWMEPVLGQISFVLLCMAFARAQFKTLGIKPYSKAILESRAETLAKEFPQYDPEIIKLYSMSQPFEWSLVNFARKIQGL